MMLILIFLYLTEIFLDRIVIPLSLSRSLLSNLVRQCLMDETLTSLFTLSDPVKLALLAPEH